jgi:hypothetical protein
MLLRVRAPFSGLGNTDCQDHGRDAQFDSARYADALQSGIFAVQQLEMLGSWGRSSVGRIRSDQGRWLASSITALPF